MNFGMAIAPWLFGVLADATTTNIAISVGIGVSCLAAAINFPLTCDPRFGRKKQLLHPSKRVLGNEDPDFVEKALAGDLVSSEALLLVNFARLQAGKPPIVPRVKPYTEDKGSGLQTLHGDAEELFLQRMATIDRVLLALYDPEPEKSPEELCQLLNSSMDCDEEIMTEAIIDLGKWFGDYLHDAGYNPHHSSAMIKQMVLTALPPISFEREYTPENLQLALLRGRHVFARYAQGHKMLKEEDWSFSDAFGKGAAVVFY